MKQAHGNQLLLTHFIHNSVMTVVTRPKRDSDIPIFDVISISEGGFVLLD